MSQWGSMDLGEQGYSPIEIIRYYYLVSILGFENEVKGKKEM